MIFNSNIIENNIKKKIEETEKKHNVKLSTAQKIVLSTNGPLSSIISALYGDIHLFALKQRFEKANEETAKKVGVNEGDEVHHREIIVHKHGRPLMYALSHLPKSRCSEEMIEDLVEEKLVLGTIIFKHRIETFREITDISIEKPSPTLKELFQTDEDMLTREYTMTHNGEILIWTKEAYPISYFTDKIGWWHGR